MLEMQATPSLMQKSLHWIERTSTKSEAFWNMKTSLLKVILLIILFILLTNYQ